MDKVKFIKELRLSERYMDFDEEAILEHLDAQSKKPKMAAKKGEA